MADQKVTELPIKGTSGINLADYLFGIDSAEGYQMLISDLAKKIVESYSGSSLAGSARTLKNALDTVASNAGGNMATIESSTTASKAYAVGDYMVRNGQLYKVTAAIASGGTITVGTNVAAAAAADDIAGISNTIGNTAMGTTAQTITGAIAEHEQDISGLNSNVMNSSAGSISVTISGGTVQNNTVIKSGRSLNIFLTVVNASATANGNIGILPSDFTPQGPRVLMGYIIVNNTRIPMRFNVNAQGAITLSYSTTQTMTQVEIMGTIPL